jgi:hypothetical protein
MVSVDTGLVDFLEEYLVRLGGGQGGSKEELLSRCQCDAERVRLSELLETLDAVWELLHGVPASHDI